jgi:general secretion pathway protein C
MKFALAFRAPSSGHHGPWPSLSALVLWAAAAASLVFWLLRWGEPLTHDTAVAQVEPTPALDVTALAQWLGGGAGGKVLSPLSGRFKVLGVVTDRAGAGVALISVEGQPARPYRVGAQIEPGLVLQKLLPRSVQLGATVQGASLLSLELPAARQASPLPH